MYLIKMVRDCEIPIVNHFMVVYMDSTNLLALLNVDMQPFIMESKSGRVDTFIDIDHVLAILEHRYNPTQILYSEVESIFDIGNVCLEEMQSLYKN